VRLLPSTGIVVYFAIGKPVVTGAGGRPAAITDDPKIVASKLAAVTAVTNLFFIDTIVSS
jgi:hypothetical protein